MAYRIRPACLALALLLAVAGSACAQQRGTLDSGVLTRAFAAVPGLTDRCIAPAASWREVQQKFFARVTIFQLTCIREHGDSATGYAAIEQDGNTYPLGDEVAFRFLTLGTFSGGVDSASVLSYLRIALPLMGVTSAPITIVQARNDVPPNVPDSTWARVKLPVIIHERTGQLTVELTVAERRRLVRIKVRVVASGKGEIEILESWPIWVDPNLP